MSPQPALKIFLCVCVCVCVFWGGGKAGGGSAWCVLDLFRSQGYEKIEEHFFRQPLVNIPNFVDPNGGKIQCVCNSPMTAVCPLGFSTAVLCPALHRLFSVRNALLYCCAPLRCCAVAPMLLCPRVVGREEQDVAGLTNEQTTHDVNS